MYVNMYRISQDFWDCWTTTSSGACSWSSTVLTHFSIFPQFTSVVCTFSPSPFRYLLLHRLALLAEMDTAGLMAICSLLVVSHSKSTIHFFNSFTKKTISWSQGHQLKLWLALLKTNNLLWWLFGLYLIMQRKRFVFCPPFLFFVFISIWSSRCSVVL